MLVVDTEKGTQEDSPLSPETSFTVSSASNTASGSIGVPASFESYKPWNAANACKFGSLARRG
jgi:hypothetical protein